MPDTKGYPRNKKGKNAYIADCVKTVKKENPSKDMNAVLGQCEGMWRNHWNEKKKSNANLTEAEFEATFSWDDCPECLERERAANHKHGIFELDIPRQQF